MFGYPNHPVSPTLCAVSNVDPSGWLVSKGRADKAQAVLSRLHSDVPNYNVHEEMVRALPSDIHSVSTAHPLRPSCLPPSRRNDASARPTPKPDNGPLSRAPTAGDCSLASGRS